MDSSQHEQSSADMNKTVDSPLQFDEQTADACSSGSMTTAPTGIVIPDAKCTVLPVSSTGHHPISQSLTRGYGPNLHAVVTNSLPASPSVSAPVSIPASSRVVTGFDGPTSSPGAASSPPLSLPSSQQRSNDSSNDHSNEEFPTSPLSQLTLASVSPNKVPCGSLLSQRLSGMPQNQLDMPEVEIQQSPFPHEHPAGQKSPLRQSSSVQSQAVPNCFGSPASQKSFASSTSQFSAVSHEPQSKVLGCSMNTSNSSTPQSKKKDRKMKLPLKVDIPKRHHTFSESAKCEESPASFRSYFGSITVWRSSSILSRHLSQGGSSRIVNYVTEAQSVLPSLTSAFSIDHLEEKEFGRRVELAMYDLQDNQRAASHQDKLEILDILEDNEYVDTVKSTDSAASLLRRSMSVPPQYHYKSQKHHHVQDIFNQEQTQQANLDPVMGKSQVKPAAIRLAEKDTQWRQTMDDLLEQPEYMDTLESVCSRTGLLASQAQAIAQQYGTKSFIEPVIESPLTPAQSEQNVTVKQLRFIYFKNLVVLSLGFMFVFMAYMSLRNLQSSLYKSGGLGLLALSLIYANLFLGCIFATTIVQHLRPKRTIVICMGSILLYVAANFYPSYYTLLPACAITGFCLSNLWTAHATYLANVAARYAILIDDKVQNVLSHFNGIFFAFFQMSQIVGGLISSLVLSPSRETPGISINNMTNLTEMMLLDMNNSAVFEPQCGAGFCSYLADSPQSTDNNSTVDKNMFYILVGTYAGCVIVGLAIILLCLDPLDGVMKKSEASLSRQLTAVFRFFLQWKVVCLLGLMFYTMLQSSFMFGEFTKAFVTCTSGVYLVGYTMVCLSGMSALSSFVSGRVQRYVGRRVLFGLAFLIHISIIMVDLLWKPGSEHIVVIFIIAGCWGLADGMMLTQTISLFGILFTDNKEPAFAGLKMTQAFGVTILFATSEYLCTFVKLIILLIFATLAMAGLTVLEIRLKNEKKSQHVEPTSV